MSTRQRFMHETSAPPMTEGALVLARAVDGDPSLAQDIAARRLRELSQRLSAPPMLALAADGDTKLEKSDAEFEPVSLAAILAIGRRQTPDTPDDTLIDRAADAPALIPLSTPTSAPSAEPSASIYTHIEPATLPVRAVALEPAAPLRLAGETLLVPDEAPSESSGQASPDTMLAAEMMPGESTPLLLADQSAPDIRLVDLIRRQQSLLDQLNSFPPSYKEPEGAAEAAPAAPVETARSVIELLAPPTTTAPPEVRETREVKKEETPPPLPPTTTNIHREPPRLTAPAARERTDEPAAADLPQHSPMIIQRARAERSVRRGPVVAAPPSAVPAFLGGLAAALIVAGVLFVIL